MNTDLIIYQCTQNIITDTNIDYLDIVWKMSNQGEEAQLYVELIKNAKMKNYKTRDEAKSKETSGYVEQHHILPTALGGNNDKLNLIFLSAQEHFNAHYLLSNIFISKYFNSKMLHAARWIMYRGGELLITPEEYETIQKNFSVISSEQMKGNAHAKGHKLSDKIRKHISEKLKGSVVTKETRIKISIGVSGENNGMYGKTHSKETKQRMSERNKGENNPMFGVESPLKGKNHTQSAKQKMSDANKGEKHYNFGGCISEEQKEKISNSMLGEKNHFFGKSHSEEVCNVISEKNKIARKKDKALVEQFEKWITSNSLPEELKYKGKGNYYQEKLFYTKELIKLSLIKIP